MMTTVQPSGTPLITDGGDWHACHLNETLRWATCRILGPSNADRAAPLREAHSRVLSNAPYSFRVPSTPPNLVNPPTPRVGHAILCNYTFMRGSRATLSPSPTTFTAITKVIMAKPGNVMIQGAARR